MPDYQDDSRIILTEAITEMCTIDTNVVVCPRVVEGQAGPVLAEVAEGAALLVVGSRGHRGPGRGPARLGRPVLRAPRYQHESATPQPGVGRGERLVVERSGPPPRRLRREPAAPWPGRRRGRR